MIVESITVAGLVAIGAFVLGERVERHRWYDAWRSRRFLHVPDGRLDERVMILDIDEEDRLCVEVLDKTYKIRATREAGLIIFMPLEGGYAEMIQPNQPTRL